MGTFSPDYPGGFADGPVGNTPITSTVMNNVEGALAAEDARNPASEAALDLAARYGQDVRPWAASTVYTAGQAVVSPGGDVVTAKTAHTSGATYSGTSASGNWNLSTTFAHDSGYVISDYSKLLPFYAALANRAEARCTIVQIGDSITEGAYCSDLSNATTPARLAQSLRARFPVIGVTGGRGFIPAANAVPGVTPIVTLSAGVGSSTGWGPALTYATVAAAGQTLTVSLTGTSFDIMYLKGSGFGIGYYTIDGGTAVTFDTSNATSTDGNILHVTMTAGTHTVVVGWSSGGTVYIDGFIEYNGDESAGVSLVRGGHSGSSTSDWLSQTTWYASIPPLAPSLIVLQFGVNDSNPAIGNLTSAAFSTNLQTLISGLRAKFTTPPPFVLSMLYQRSGSFVESWQNYVTAAKQIATSDAAVVAVDHSARMPTTTATNTYGLYYGDNVHPSDKGYALIAETFAAVLSPR
jgi:lysophospholipase L1-like esterase